MDKDRKESILFPRESTTHLPIAADAPTSEFPCIRKTISFFFFIVGHY
jgi:hypothetical protein